MPDPQNLPYLLKLIDDDSKLVRNAILKELASFGPSLENEINKLGERPDPIKVIEIKNLLRDYRKSLDQTNNSINLFNRGQIIKHKKFGYRGVIVEFDLKCKASEKWYKNNTKSSPIPPDKNQPWYYVLVDKTQSTTYVAETNLLVDDSEDEVNHILIPYFFSEFKDGEYIRNETQW